MSIISLFTERYLPIYYTYQLPSIIIINIFNYHKLLYISKSKMVIYKNGKFILNCSHYVNTIFYSCPNFIKDEHLHCGRCGLYLKNNIKLRKVLYNNFNNVNIYSYKRSCLNLTDNHNFY